jgi:hypothetical protein
MADPGEGEKYESRSTAESVQPFSKRDIVKAAGLIGAGTMVAGCTTDSSSSNGDDTRTTTSETPPDGEMTPSPVRDGAEFIDHGKTGFIVYNQGWLGTTDGNGNDVVLLWMYASEDGRLSMVNVDSGEYDEFRADTPTDSRGIGQIFASLLSSENRYYVCNRHFMEFDLERQEITFLETNLRGGGFRPARAMSMYEDDEGVIWAACYFNASLFSYNPMTGEFRDHGDLYDHPSQLYPETLAGDDQGWIYLGIVPAAGQILMYNPETEETKTVLSKGEEGEEGPHRVRRGENGKVYGQTGDRYFELYEGTATELDEAVDTDPYTNENDTIQNGYTREIDGSTMITGGRGLHHRQLPSGRRITMVDLRRKDPYIGVKNPDTGEEQQISISPTGGDGRAMEVTRAPNNRIVGGTYLPPQFFNFDAESGEMFRDSIHWQWNTAEATDEYVYFGAYAHGVLLEWDPTQEWNPPKERSPNPERNPRFLANNRRHVRRPYALGAQPNGPYVVMGGNPEKGKTGGGLLFWNRDTETSKVLSHEAVIQWQVTMSLAPLSNGSMVGGTTVTPTMGGVQKADVATLYLLDPDTQDITWSGSPFDGVEEYTDLLTLSGREVLGIADRDRLFAFDPQTQQVEFEHELESETAYLQGPKVLVEGPNGRIFLLLDQGGIVEIERDPSGGGPSEEVPAGERSYTVTQKAEAPLPIRNGGAYLDGRLYFATRSNLYSWRVPPAE